MTAADFDKKVVVITGASGGIGNAIGRAFVDCRARVICADLQPPDIDVGMLFCRTDVGDDASARALFAFAEKECGGVDVLVNCAGIVLEKPVVQTSAAEWDRIMAVNVRGVFLCAKYAAILMQKRGGGAIVNIGSIEALGANPAHAAYAASKGAVHSLTRNLALELGAYNIRCNAVAPGWIDTPFNDNNRIIKIRRGHIAPRRPAAFSARANISNFFCWRGNISLMRRRTSSGFCE